MLWIIIEKVEMKPNGFELTELHYVLGNFVFYAFSHALEEEGFLMLSEFLLC